MIVSFGRENVYLVHLLFAFFVDQRKPNQMILFFKYQSSSSLIYPRRKKKDKTKLMNHSFDESYTSLMKFSDQVFGILFQMIRWIFFFSISIQLAYGFPDGAPSSACISMMPQHDVSPKQCQVKYIIEADKSEYNPQDTIRSMI